MSKITSDSTAFWVEVTDEAGESIGRSVLAFIDYTVEVDYSFGEDADGTRGITQVEYSILKTWISTGDVKTLTPDQAQRVIEDAERIFKRTPKHFR